MPHHPCCLCCSTQVLCAHLFAHVELHEPGERSHHPGERVVISHHPCCLC